MAFFRFFSMFFDDFRHPRGPTGFPKSDQKMAIFDPVFDHPRIDPKPGLFQDRPGIVRDRPGSFRDRSTGSKSDRKMGPNQKKIMYSDARTRCGNLRCHKNVIFDFGTCMVIGSRNDNLAKVTSSSFLMFLITYLLDMGFVIFHFSLHVRPPSQDM